MIFAGYFILRGRDMHIDFLRLLFLVGVICPGDLSSDARTFIAAEKPHQSSGRPEDLFTSDYLNQIACYVPTKKAM